MSSRRRFFLCALLAAACSLAARPQGFAQKAAQVDPFAASPQSYAALDLSGTSTHGSPVSLLALDDRNQAAFLFKQASGAEATWQAKLWQNGALGDGQSFPAQAPQPELSALLGGAVVQEYHPMHLQTSGEAVGESVATDSFENSGHGNTYLGPGFRAAEGRCDNLAAPRPYQYQFGNYPAGWGAKLELSALSAQGYGGAFVYTRILTAPPYVVPGSPNLGSPAAFIQQGDVTISFDPDAPGSLADTGTLQVVRRKFQPGALNAKGWALGEPAGWYWGDTGNLLWNGGQRQLVALAGRGVALNEDNDVLVAGVWNPTTQRQEGAHLLAQGDPAKKRVFAGAGAGLLPATAEPHLRNVYPFLMSNRVAAPGDGSVQPVLHMLFQAEVERSPAVWSPSSVFVLRLLSDDTSEVQEVVYPQGVTNVQLKSINTSGVIAALGNVGPGEKHALLLLPVGISVRKKGTIAAPEDGLIVKNGDTLQVAFAPGWFDIEKQFASSITWQYQQLTSSGKYTAWQSFDVGNNGTKFDYSASVSGIFQIKAIISFNNQNQEYYFLRKKDEKIAGAVVGWGRKQKPDAYGVVDTDVQMAIQHSAKINLGSRLYDPEKPFPPFPANKDKCNLFVAHKAQDASAIVPWINGSRIGNTTYPPTANQWAGTDPKPISRWDLLPAQTMPQPGFVVADPSSEGSGHCGILDYDGWGIAAGTHEGVSKLYPFLGTSRQRQYKP